MEHVAQKAVTAVTAALKGISFPASRQDLVQHARRAGAHEDTVHILERMPDGTYEQMADVTHNMSRVQGR